jgi:glycosyltransferase involved in cell wall biosynthesis
MIACGFTIVDLVPGIDEIFLGFWTKIAFGTPDEARIRIEYYLNDEAERDRLWKLQREAIKPYSYENCAKVILDRIKGCL